MRWGKKSLKAVLFIALLASSLLTFAAEEKAEKKEGGEGGESKGKASTALPVSESTEIEINIAALQAKVKAKEEDLKGLIAEKGKLEDKNPRVNEVVKLMASTYQELRSLQEELEKQKSILRFRFPDRGSESKASKKEKDAKEPENLEKYEQEVTTKQQLDHTLEHAEKVYGVEKSHKSSAQPKRDEDPENSTLLIQNNSRVVPHCFLFV